MMGHRVRRDDDERHEIAIPWSPERVDAHRADRAAPTDIDPDVDAAAQDYVERWAEERRPPEHARLWRVLDERREVLVERLDELRDHDPDSDVTRAAEERLRALDRQLRGVTRDAGDERAPTTARLREILRNASGVTREEAIAAIVAWIRGRSHKYVRDDTTRAAGGGRLRVLVVDDAHDAELLEAAEHAVGVHVGRPVSLLSLEARDRAERHRVREAGRQPPSGRAERVAARLLAAALTP